MGKKIINGLESHIELDGFTARNYDLLMDIASFGLYPKFINSSIRSLGVEKGEKVLDLGCGTGRNLELIMHYSSYSGEYYGIDIGDEMLEQARRRFRGRKNIMIQKASILDELPFGGDFDHITTAFVLHGFSHEQRMQIAELAADKLKKGAVFSFLDWTPGNMKANPLWFRIFFRAVECPIANEFIQHDYSREFESVGLKHIESIPRIRGLARVVRMEKT